MKKVLALVALLFVVNASYSANKGEIARYLKIIFQDRDIEFISISDIDSIYSPYQSFIAAEYFLAKKDLEHEIKLFNLVDDSHSTKIDFKRNVLSADSIYTAFKEIADREFTYYAEQSVSPNRTSVDVSFKVAGFDEVLNMILFYNVNSETIGHSSIDLMDKHKAIVKKLESVKVKIGQTIELINSFK